MRPSRDEVLMQSAMVWRQRATCSRAQVGVVVALDGRVLSTGYNGSPAGMPHCSHECNCGMKLSNHEPDKDGFYQHYPICQSIQPCLESVHAEANAIAFAARHGARVGGAEMFTTLTPCTACAQLIINAGITRVVAREAYRKQDGWLLLDDAGVDTMILG